MVPWAFQVVLGCFRESSKAYQGLSGLLRFSGLLETFEGSVRDFMGFLVISGTFHRAPKDFRTVLSS